MSNYKDYGFNTDGITHNLTYMIGPLLTLLDKNKNKAILDLGCGNGYLANFLIAQGFNVYGTDASEKGIILAKKTNPDRFFVQDLSTGKLPVELQQLSFDTIISTEVIEHLYDPEAFIAFCRQLLAANCEIIISTPYHGYLKNLLLSLSNKWDRHLDPSWLGGHIKLWSAKTLGALLKRHNFEVTDFKGCGRIPYLWKSMILKARLN